MANFTFSKLDWDTDYFGVRSGRFVFTGNLLPEDVDQFNSIVKEYDFITISNLNNNPYNNFWLGKETKSFLTDVNIQFTKKLESDSKINRSKEITIFNAYPKNETVLKIAKESFYYSRFFNDPWLPHEKAKNIYVQWTESAFDKNNKYFAIAKINHVIAGFLLFSINEAEKYGTIELIAVDSSFRGLNIGKALLTETEAFLMSNGFEFVKVGTQVVNTVATRLYSSCGYKYSSCNSVYHLWPFK